MSQARSLAPLAVVAGDSHPLYLIGLTGVIQRSPDLTLTAATGSGREALALIREHQPPVAVLALRLRDLDSRDIVRTLRREASVTRVLLISEYQSGELVLQCLTAGAAGFLTTFASPETVRDAILAVGRGESVLPSDAGPLLAGALQARGETRHQVITDRELEILELLAQGESSGGIAVRLGVAVPTVKSHIQNLYVKLGVNDRGAAVATGIRRGLIS